MIRMPSIQLGTANIYTTHNGGMQQSEATAKEIMDFMPESNSILKQRRHSEGSINLRNYQLSAPSPINIDDVNYLRGIIEKLYFIFHDFSLACVHPDINLLNIPAYVSQGEKIGPFEFPQYPELDIFLRQVGAAIDETVEEYQEQEKIELWIINDISKEGDRIAKELVENESKKFNKSYFYKLEWNANFEKAKNLVEMAHKGVRALEVNVEIITEIIDEKQAEFQLQFTEKSFLFRLISPNEKERLATERFEKIRDHITFISNQIKKCKKLAEKLERVQKIFELEFKLCQIEGDIQRNNNLLQELEELPYESLLNDKKQEIFTLQFLIIIQEGYLDKQSQLLRKSLVQYNESASDSVEKQKIDRLCQELDLHQEALAQQEELLKKLLNQCKESASESAKEHEIFLLKREIKYKDRYMLQQIEALEKIAEACSENKPELAEEQIIDSLNLRLIYRGKFRNKKAQYLKYLQDQIQAQPAMSNFSQQAPQLTNQVEASISNLYA